MLPYRAVSIGTYDGAPKDRERAIDAARLILERLAGPSLPPPPDAHLPRPTATRDLTRPSTASPAPAPGATERSIETALATTPAPAVPAADPPAPAAEVTGSTTLEIVVDSARASELRAVIGTHGDITEERPVTWTTEVRFRGSVEEKHHPAVRFTVVADRAEEAALRLAVSAYRLRSLEVVASRPTARAGTS